MVFVRVAADGSARRRGLVAGVGRDGGDGVRAGAGADVAEVVLVVSPTASVVHAGRGILLAVVLLVEGVADLGEGECVGLARESVSRGDRREATAWGAPASRAT